MSNDKPLCVYDSSRCSTPEDSDARRQERTGSTFRCGRLFGDAHENLTRSYAQP
ncbi:hypothetical protein [Nostoc sp.]|uniref:hypothetical protein n=1 Tax=Nostoc sp. TaxID=1180 RepID=UPI002FF6FCBF